MIQLKEGQTVRDRAGREWITEGNDFLYESGSYDAERKYAEYNDLYFNNELPRDLPIEYVDNNRSNAIAFANHLRSGEPKDITINTSQFNSLNEREKDSVFIHEMIHIWTFITGQFNSRNIHKGVFHSKAKEIEAMNPALTLTGTTLKPHEDDFKDMDKQEVYMVFYTYHQSYSDEEKIYPLTQKSVSGVKIYSIDTPLSEIKNDRSIPSSYHVGYIYEVTTNSPIIPYAFVEKVLNKNFSLTDKATRQLLGAVKKNKKYSEFIERFKTPHFK